VRGSRRWTSRRPGQRTRQRRHGWWWLVAALAVTGLGVAGYRSSAEHARDRVAAAPPCIDAGTLRRPSSTAPTSPKAPSIALGVNEDNVPDDPAALDHFRELTGRKPDIVMWFQNWSEPLFYPGQLDNLKRTGATPMITWSPDGAKSVLREVAAGKWDDYVDSAARAAADFRLPLYIRLAHEMNVSSSPYGPGAHGNTPPEFISAWRHVVGLFRAASATNVSWVWSPNVDCQGSCPFEDFYPGDPWVDVAGLDGYNTGGNQWTSFESLFVPSYKRLAALTCRPIIIAETASAELGGDKAQWVRTGLLETAPRKMPRVRAVIWFDRLKESDWRIDSSPAALWAWRQVVSARPYRRG
jgi:mannan endo-1,4-beta-mannosidase